MEEEIINRVAGSGLVEINLEDLSPVGERILLDLKPFLFQGLVLKEKDFRAMVNETDWERYRDKFVAIHCSADAIIPTWAYMLIAVNLQPFAKKFIYGDLGELETSLFLQELASFDLSPYQNARVMIRGCGKIPVPESAYVEISRLLCPVAQSIMYGEACSTVPLMKKK